MNHDVGNWPLPLKRSCWLYGGAVGVMIGVLPLLEVLIAVGAPPWSTPAQQALIECAYMVPVLGGALAGAFLGAYVGQRLRPRFAAAILGATLGSALAWHLVQALTWLPLAAHGLGPLRGDWTFTGDTAWRTGAISSAAFCFTIGMFLARRASRWWVTGLAGSSWGLGFGVSAPLIIFSLHPPLDPGEVNFGGIFLVLLFATLAGMILGVAFWLATPPDLRGAARGRGGPLQIDFIRRLQANLGPHLDRWKPGRKQ